MHCTFIEAAKLLGYKSPATLYRLKDQNKINQYIERINGINYIDMGRKRGISFAEFIRANVQDKNGFMPYNFDPSNDLGMVINLK